MSVTSSGKTQTKTVTMKLSSSMTQMGCSSVPKEVVVLNIQKKNQVFVSYIFIIYHEKNPTELQTMRTHNKPLPTGPTFRHQNALVQRKQADLPSRLLLRGKLQSTLGPGCNESYILCNTFSTIILGLSHPSWISAKKLSWQKDMLTSSDAV